jgi:DNA helicase-2/ATP-dependent DNA helicase PcrA
VAEGADPQSIVAFTFTEKAAESIKYQVAKALATAGLEPTILGAMYIGTTHSYCQYVLQEMDARYRQFDVLDENRLKLYLMSRYPGLVLNRLRPRANGRYFEVIRQISEAWKTVNDEVIPVQEVTKWDQELGDVLAALGDNLARDQFIDFSLMIRLVVDALLRRDDSAERAVAKLSHLMVDEYQDINPSQEALIRELHRRSSTLFVVGDDDQAIYAWRGADVNNILTFGERYPNCKEHTLSHNFRSTPTIVSCADQFVASELGAARMTKNPTASEPPGPSDVRNVWFTTRGEEAEWVAERIINLIGTGYQEQDGRTRGLTPGDFAILMRSTRASEQDGTPRHAAFTNALSARGVSYSLDAGGGVFDRPQVRVLRNTFELLREESPSRDTALSHFRHEVQPAYPSARLDRFTAVLSHWGRQVHAPTGSTRRRVYPQQLVHDLLSAFGVDQGSLDAGTMQDIGVFSRMIQDVETVYVSIDSPDRFRDVLNFLSQVAENGYDTATADILQRPDAVTVSTVHRVKGLEFPVVFVVDVEAQRFPNNQRGYQGWLPTPVIQRGLNRGAYRGTREEEARLFYTALTRAERFLYVSGCERLPGGAQRRRPSVFAQRLVGPDVSSDPSGMPTGLIEHPPVPRIDETVVPTSYSDIRYYLRCPQDYRYRKGYGFSPPIPDLFGFGMTVHAAVCKLHEVFQERGPTAEEAETVARDIFHLKHVPPSRDPENRPGAYERARDSATDIARTYAESYGQDFAQERQVEVRFEVPVEKAVISGSIDLMLRFDENGDVLETEVVDFKAMEGGEDPAQNEKLHWTELALQVQLYAKAANEVLGRNARTGSVHLLKDNQRIDVPVTDEAIQAAVRNVEWAVERVLAGDFPMRPQQEKCNACDFKLLCPKVPEEFKTGVVPPPLHIAGPLGKQEARAFSEFEQDRI